MSSTPSSSPLPIRVKKLAPPAGKVIGIIGQATVMSIVPDPEDQKRLKNDAYQAGITAAENGRQADCCPYPTGSRRKQWLAGFFSAKPLLKKTCCQND